jgi:DNA segregation ATPase FtsK/SpoIIIE-like protein
MAREQENRTLDEVLGIILLGIGTLLFLALISYTPKDIPEWFPLSRDAPANHPAQNFIGPFGAIIAGCVYFFLGAGSYLLAATFLGYGGAKLLAPGTHLSVRSLWVIAFLLSGACLLELQDSYLRDWPKLMNIKGPGGLLGYWLGERILRAWLGNYGSKIIVGVVYLASLILMTRNHARRDHHPLRGLSRRRRARGQDQQPRARSLPRPARRAHQHPRAHPGKDTVGIEIANSNKVAVFLRELLESRDWRNTNAKIPIALGKDVYGKTLVADLAAMPHLLIGGTTGSGKSVCINCILMSFLFRFTPDELRLILIDPKQVEMQVYNAIPHLVVPVVTDPKKVMLALRWVINEMEKRYRILAKVGVRNIASFNARPRNRQPLARAESPQWNFSTSTSTNRRRRRRRQESDDRAVPPIRVPREDDLIIPDKLPYIVVIVDELADLMQTAPADVESAVARLTAKARAAGIHLIVATQTPRREVVTGVIKTNIPARIAFQVPSGSTRASSSTKTARSACSARATAALSISFPLKASPRSRRTFTKKWKLATRAARMSATRTRSLYRSASRSCGRKKRRAHRSSSAACGSVTRGLRASWTFWKAAVSLPLAKAQSRARFWSILIRLRCEAN